MNKSRFIALFLPDGKDVGRAANLYVCQAFFRSSCITAHLNVSLFAYLGGDKINRIFFCHSVPLDLLETDLHKHVFKFQVCNSTTSFPRKEEVKTRFQEYRNAKYGAHLCDPK